MNIKNSPFSPILGLGRSLIAFGTLISFLFNDADTLFVQKTFKTDDIWDNINIFNIFGYNNLNWSISLSIIILVITISGYFIRITGILHWWITYSFLNSAIIIDGGDQISSILTLLIVPICILDNRKNHWLYQSIESSEIKKFIATSIFFVIKFQTSVLYFNAAVGKFPVDEWWDGTAMYYWVNHSSFGAPNYLKSIILPLIENKYSVFALTWGTIILELFLSISVFLKKELRIFACFIGIFFHFLIFIILGLGSFFFAMSGTLILYLIPFNFNLIEWNIMKNRILIRSGLK
ncbi:HTTM domain-containing protein [Chryseobacterium fluminis]|uniref:sporulation-delaying protein SdpB family protein n=1 Tax=Chryseobacterium fluminis TaxID=2983606 RepID=UPI00224F67B4|nr:sporulation-delaying protein SdpB family protein [Chryseobacterium sp. MMS21-Ot14]UZT99070.1 HTTM domain-containing protein [Chryseobacterium sp. MMS21-Ot14]